MKKILIFVFLIIVFTLHSFALEGITVEGVVKPFTVNSVSGTGITINDTFYRYDFSNDSDDQYLDDIEASFNVQNNALVLCTPSISAGIWSINIYISQSLDILGDWYLASYTTPSHGERYTLNYTLTDGITVPEQPHKYKIWGINLKLSYDGIVKSCNFGSNHLSYRQVEGYIFTQKYADRYNTDVFNYTDFGIAWCNNPVMYGDELLYDGGSTAPEEPLPDTPEYDSLLDAIIDLPRRFAEFIRSLFIPSEDFISNKFNALRQNFVFADSIISATEFIRETFIDISNDPPVIYLNLSAAESEYNWGNTAVSLDLTWYTRYKPFVDALVSAIVTVFFLWRVFKNLPSIISGVQGVNKDDL